MVEIPHSEATYGIHHHYGIGCWHYEFLVESRNIQYVYPLFGFIFCGILLKHTVDKYIQKIKDYSLSLFVTMVLFLSVWGILTIHQIGTESTIYCYTNPLVILQAVFLFLVFDKMKIKSSNMINHIAASSFMVYMMSENIHTRKYFVSIVRSIFSIDSEYLTIVTYVVFFFVAYLALTAIDKVLSKIYIPCINWINNTGMMKKLSILFS